MPNVGAQDFFARWFRDSSSNDGERPTAPKDLASRVMVRLPQGSPALYHAVAALVVEAWGDESLREQLRSAPEATLAEHGLQLPEGMHVDIVPSTAVMLPESHRLTLPLAASDTEPEPTTADEARAILAQTDWRWLLDEQTATTASVWQVEQEPGEAAKTNVAAFRAPGGRSGFDWRRWLPRPATAIAGVAAAVLLAMAAATESSLGEGSPLSGTAGGAPPWALLAAAVAIVAALVWWTGRRGG